MGSDSSCRTKSIEDLEPGDVMVALVHPDGRVYAIRGGPFAIASVTPTGGEWEGQAQFEIRSARRSRAARYSNGATHAILTGP